MTSLADHLDTLVGALKNMFTASQADILKKIDELFGERFGREERKILMRRYDRRDASSELLIQSGTGTIFAPAIVKARSDIQPVPQHRFHSGRMPLREDFSDR